MISSYPNIDKFDTDHDKARLYKTALRKERGNKAKAVIDITCLHHSKNGWNSL